MILDKIAAAAQKRIEQKKAGLPLEKIKKTALRLEAARGFPFEAALSRGDISFIAEVKKASPSQGVIDGDYAFAQIAQAYEAAGADAISVLTEPDYFLGSDEHLAQIKDIVSIPLLRKDFIVDPYQIYEAKILGASAVLLICALMNTGAIRDCLSICDELGLSALVETHDAWEIDSALAAQARVIGVNNRNLQNFTVDIENCIKLRSLVPDNLIYVAESGIKTVADIEILRQAKVDAVLIGTTLMRTADKSKMLAELRGGRYD